MKRASLSTRITVGRTRGALEKKDDFKKLFPLAEKAIMLEELCSVLFGKVLDWGTPRLTIWKSRRNPMGLPLHSTQYGGSMRKSPC